MKKLSIALFFFAITGCAASPQELAIVEDCREKGNTAYTYSSGRLKHCISPAEQERLERLELACVSAGGKVDYDSTGKYRNCLGTSSVKVKVNNNGSFDWNKAYCKYQKGGCK